MSTKRDSDNWDGDFKKLLGASPVPDFAKWQARFNVNLSPDPQPVPNSSPGLLDGQSSRSMSRRRMLKTVFQIAASILIVCGTAWSLIPTTLDKSLFAGQILGIDKVIALSWTESFYIRVTSEDKKRNWIEIDQAKVQYQHPGKFRKTYYDRTGQPRSIQIIDAKVGRVLTLDPEHQSAELKHVTEQFDQRGPFAWVGDYIRGKHPGVVTLGGKTQIDSVEANIVRWKGKSNEGKTRFYLSVDSHQLIGMTSINPGVDFDPENFDQKLLAAKEERWHFQEPIASRTHDIMYQGSTDALAFSLDAPEGYKVVNVAKPTVTEEDMIAFLRAAVEFNTGVFPDSLVEAFDREKFNTASRLSESERSKESQALIESRDRIMRREIYRAPILQFIEDHTEPETFQYVGSEIKLGDTNAIVAWYRPKQSNQYRVWFGDLSIKERTAQQLPILKEQIEK